MEELASSLEIARGYPRELETGETGAALNKFLSPDVAMAEFPNRLTPLGKRRDLAAALEGRNAAKRPCLARSIR